MSGPETQKANNESWSDKIGRAFEKVNGHIKRDLIENTTISDDFKQVMSMALDIELPEVVSEILDASTKYKDMRPEDQVRRLLTDRILKAVGAENVYREDGEPTPIADFLKQTVL